MKLWSKWKEIILWHLTRYVLDLQEETTQNVKTQPNSIEKRNSCTWMKSALETRDEDVLNIEIKFIIIEDSAELDTPIHKVKTSGKKWV